MQWEVQHRLTSLAMWNDATRIIYMDTPAVRHRAGISQASADKLGLPEAGIVDVLNVKSDLLLIGSLRGQKGYFLAYHMNKEKWLSIQLGKPELDDAIKDLLSLSYELTAPKKRNLKSSGKNPGDSANGKEKEIDEG